MSRDYQTRMKLTLFRARASVGDARKRSMRASLSNYAAQNRRPAHRARALAASEHAVQRRRFEACQADRAAALHCDADSRSVLVFLRIAVNGNKLPPHLARRVRGAIQYVARVADRRCRLTFGVPKSFTRYAQRNRIFLGANRHFFVARIATRCCESHDDA